jgi:hypothetical protein
VRRVEHQPERSDADQYERGRGKPGGEFFYHMDSLYKTFSDTGANVFIPIYGFSPPPNSC